MRPLQSLAVLLDAAGALGETAAQAAGDLPHLSPADPTAQALGYHESAKTVDVKQFPTYQPGQRLQHLSAAAGHGRSALAAVRDLRGQVGQLGRLVQGVGEEALVQWRGGARAAPPLVARIAFATDVDAVRDRYHRR